MQIFLIEDDKALAEGIAFTLKKEGYRTEIFTSCCAGRQALKEERPDLVLLDWNLPDGDGLALCGEISEKWGIPVLMITARDMGDRSGYVPRKRRRRLYCQAFFPCSIKGKDRSSFKERDPFGKDRIFGIRGDPSGGAGDESLEGGKGT